MHTKNSRKYNYLRITHFIILRYILIFIHIPQHIWKNSLKNSYETKIDIFFQKPIYILILSKMQEFFLMKSSMLYNFSFSLLQK